MTIYHLIRHGESEANEKRADRICGRSSETPLTEKGHQQARLLGTWCVEQGIHFDRICTSKAVRAVQTAQGVCDAMQIAPENIVLVDDIEEKDQGEWTGAVRANIYTPEMLWIMNNSEGHFLPPGGESDRQAGMRLFQKLTQEIVPKTQGSQHVAIVSHGNVIRCMLHYFVGFPVTHGNTPLNTSITSLEYTPDLPTQFRVLTYNQAEHLGKGSS
ncbi:hypothetical protein COW46_01315 [Candidatus Gracilibacteria bacterium CG17_big_fil_post_rev_8_21_14_2_50_48_13]|nr:MAG: hypothetical protein COW46_01315 [Candidatus Gracilibacteria bacterium CG17_big_fil_post_rev_8_21_14_2_50_48_13]